LPISSFLLFHSNRAMNLIFKPSYATCSAFLLCLFYHYFLCDGSGNTPLPSPLSFPPSLDWYVMSLDLFHLLVLTFSLGMATTGAGHPSLCKLAHHHKLSGSCLPRGASQSGLFCPSGANNGKEVIAHILEDISSTTTNPRLGNRKTATNSL
jgi:hypothetical protein